MRCVLLNSYKVIVSILFGLIGFFVNFNTITFPFPPYMAVFLIGMLFPLLISLAWGWKYGLLSALAGGCQSMWWLFAAVNGYAVFFVVLPFTLWIVWHGYFADLRNKRGGGEWWLSPYAVEIPFRIINTINMYTITRWAVSLNPPPYEWASAASSIVPMHFTNFVVIKQLAVAYVILLLADVLLNLGFVRRFFRLDEKSNQTSTGYIISASLLFGGFFWFIDSVVGSLIFYHDSSFIDLFAMDIPPYVLYIRTAFILACLLGGLVASCFLRKQRESEYALCRSVSDLKRSNTDLEQFAFVASHDLQEPLRAISGYTNIVKRKYEGKIDSDSDEYIDSILCSVGTMQDLIRDLLFYSHVGTRGNKITQTDCNEIIEDVLSNLKVSIDDSGAVVTYDPLPTVMADRSQMLQVFQNLICNAIKFRDIMHPRIHVSAKKVSNKWQFSVSDNGIGIKPEFLGKIFVVFQRLHGNVDYSGTGIGLAICKKIVERHGGKIWVESEYGVGSTFYFTI